jgi:hypothetical protein
MNHGSKTACKNTRRVSQEVNDALGVIGAQGLIGGRCLVRHGVPLRTGARPGLNQDVALPARGTTIANCCWLPCLPHPGKAPLMEELPSPCAGRSCPAVPRAAITAAAAALREHQQQAPELPPRCPDTT